MPGRCGSRRPFPCLGAQRQKRWYCQRAGARGCPPLAVLFHAAPASAPTVCLAMPQPLSCPRSPGGGCARTAPWHAIPSGWRPAAPRLQLWHITDRPPALPSDTQHRLPPASPLRLALPRLCQHLNAHKSSSAGTCFFLCV